MQTHYKGIFQRVKGQFLIENDTKAATTDFLWKNVPVRKAI